MTTLKLIGYWRSKAEPGWPDPVDFVDDTFDGKERWLVAMYLSTGVMLRGFRGHSACRICGQRNGSREFTDGFFLWPEGLAHYLRAHSVRLPVAVLLHCLAGCPAYDLSLESVEIDQTWWKTITDAPG